MMKLGPNTTLWRCLECGVEFGWYPAMSGLSRPSMCGNCDQTNQFHLIRIDTPEDHHEQPRE